MIFNELYGAYYNTVAAILSEAIKHPVNDVQLQKMIMRHAFCESNISIPTALKEERWQLLKKDGTTPLKKCPSLPLSLLQKRWLKAISYDPRIRLFGEIDWELDDVEPLFIPSDILVFDRYSDGDNYSDPAYIENFRLILKAIENQISLQIEIINGKGQMSRMYILPEYLEYSEKDDKFRLIGTGNKHIKTINLGRICRCKEAQISSTIKSRISNPKEKRTVTFEVFDRRNALERVLLHFAHFEKTAERLDCERYLVTVAYDKEDEMEMVIRILSFGPMVKVTSPCHFVELIKQRLMKQKSCE